MNNSCSSNGAPQLSGVKYQSEVVTPLKKDGGNIQYGSLTPTVDDAPLIEDDRKIQSNWVKLYRILCTLTIEPVMFCYMLAYFMNIASMSNMMMDKGCLYHFNYSSEICKNLSQLEYKNEKKNVEIFATDYSMYFSCMSLIGAFFMIFIAPWSDKYSRKLPLLLAIFGATVTDAGFIFCSIHFELGNEYLLLSKIPTEIFGGFICVLAIIYSHASEVSTKQFRTVKYALVEAAFGLGICAGGLTGGLLYRYYGYVSLYMTAACLHIFCFLWVFFVVEETTGLDAVAGRCEKAKDFFVCQNMKEGFKATFRPREGSNKAIMLLLMASMCVIVLTYECFSSINFIFVHDIYNWDLTTYNFVVTAFSLVQMSLTTALVPLFIRLYNIHDFTFGIIGTLSIITKNVLISFAKYSTVIYYLGNIAGIVSGMSTLAIRSGISKLVDQDELGRVFSFLATCEAIIPIFGTVGLMKIFTATIKITPNIAYLSSALSLLLPLFTFVWGTNRIRRSYLSIQTSDHVQEKA